jgi:predicted GNAT family N-acyltransferase
MILKSIRDIDENLLKSFSCGNIELDKFINRFALTNDLNGYGKTFVLLDENRMIGFFTLCSSSIKYDEFPNFNENLFPKYPIPCVRIARLAVQNEYQGKGYGKELLRNALFRIIDVSKRVGVRLVIVDAKESSKTFYEKYGFTPLIKGKLTYYLLVDTLIDGTK